MFFGCSDGMEREACVCDHGFERSDLCAEIIIIINNNLYENFLLRFVIWLLRDINIGSSAPDWPGTVQKHSDTSTT